MTKDKTSDLLEKVIRKVVRDEFNSISSQLVTKIEFNKQISLLPTKEEFFRKMDEVVTELQTAREEQTVMSSQISNHEDRIHTVEESLQISPE